MLVYKSTDLSEFLGFVVCENAIEHAHHCVDTCFEFGCVVHAKVHHAPMQELDDAGFSIGERNAHHER